ncbi:MAG: hypothetical protein ACI8P0_005051, partial [Planctomycetaceae bacterium]
TASPNRHRSQIANAARSPMQPGRQCRKLCLMERETIQIQLTPEERSLLLRYGYPFERIAHALKACEATPDIEIVPMDYFEFERLIGDVCRSINHMDGGPVQGQLLELCDRLEAAEQSGDGMLGLL